jgi:hypothetical protein
LRKLVGPEQKFSLSECLTFKQSCQRVARGEIVESLIGNLVDPLSRLLNNFGFVSGVNRDGG